MVEVERPTESKSRILARDALVTSGKMIVVGVDLSCLTLPIKKREQAQSHFDHLEEHGKEETMLRSQGEKKSKVEEEVVIVEKSEVTNASFFSSSFSRPCLFS